jgi:MYXO-CTERM domain-containing protein
MLRVEPVRTATVNADGTFQIPDLRAGVYRLDAVNGTLTARLDRLEIIGPVDLQVRLVDSEDFPGVTVSGGCSASGRSSAPWPLAIVGLAAALFVRRRRRHPVEVR